MKNRIIAGLLLISSLLIASPVKAGFIFEGGGNLVPEKGIYSVCSEDAYYILKDIESRSKPVNHTLDQKVYLKDYLSFSLNEKLDLSLNLGLGWTTQHLMNSPKLQNYWANRIHQECPNIKEVSFGANQTDWILTYFLKDGTMVPSYKEEPNVVGMPYGEARELILKEGWVPVDTWEHRNKRGYTQEVHDNFYKEVLDCAGTGLTPCIFYFENPDDFYYLEVITQGQFYEKGNIEGQVKSVEVNSAMGGTPYGDYMN